MKALEIILFCTLTFVFIADGNAQDYDPLSPPNSYRSANNPNYWKNRPPIPGYWQQDVHYKIKAEIDEQRDVIHGEEELEYWNNSPHELEFVYFHLYQDAFQPESYYDNLNKNNNTNPEYGLYESQKLGTEVLKLRVNGKEVKTEKDNTILKVWLPTPLKAGQSVKFDIEFNTYWDIAGEARRRFKMFNAFGYKHYDGVHWYPRISVYDRKFGWTTDQHLGKEFYGDFGTFDVELTFASNFVVGATGNLLNRNEVLPSSLREKLKLENFATKPWNSPPSVVTEYKAGEKKIWKYHAENVHDFAFTADPTYRIGEAEWNGIKCYSLVQEPHASGWLNAAQYTADIIKVYSEDFGMYTYHKMIVADARDGMEYPMLTLDGGADPGYRGLLAHEVAHNWFYGQVGNNETYRAVLDEGFTTFLTSWCLDKLEGDTIAYNPPKSKYLQKFQRPTLSGNERSYDLYLKEAIAGEDPSLDTHSDHFNGALGHGGGYRQVYFKTNVMLWNLQYVLGDELFLKAMQNYFSQWKMAHPYYEDLRSSFINFTHVDLNWFFDQWLTTNQHIDYGIKCLKKTKNENEYIITFKRKGDMQMPLDFSVTNNNDSTFNFHIPNTWFEKETEATTLPRWIGWGEKLKPEYEAKVVIPNGIKKVQIDPSKRLADVYMLDNSNKTPVTYSFDHRVDNRSLWQSYEIFARPEVWYNGYDGFKTGFHLNGNYMEYLHNFSLTFWFNSGLLQHNWGDPIPDRNSFDRLSFRFTYNTALDKFIKGSGVDLEAKVLDGLDSYRAGVYKKSNDKKSKVYTYFKSMFRTDSNDLNYLLYPNEWKILQYNNTINVGVDHEYEYVKGDGNINLNLRSTTLGSSYKYAAITLDVVNRNDFGKINFNTRTFIQYGTGDNWAPESQLFMAGANPEELMENKYTRAVGFIPNDWLGHGAGTNNFQMGGGLNLRGYAGYLVPYENDENTVIFTYKGTSGAALNGELEFHELIPLNPKFLKNSIKMTTYLFGDAGIINSNPQGTRLAFSDLRADAGLGTTFTIKKWGSLEKVKPLTIRFDMPLFLNKIPAIDPDGSYFQFRWLLGVSKSF